MNNTIGSNALNYSQNHVQKGILRIMETKPIEWLTVHEASDIMDISYKSVQRVCRKAVAKAKEQKENPENYCRKFGNVWQVNKEFAEAYEKSVGGRGNTIDITLDDD